MKLSELTWGLPSEEQLRSYRIWDSYFTRAHGHPGREGSSALIAEIERRVHRLVDAARSRLADLAGRVLDGLRSVLPNDASGFG